PCDGRGRTDVGTVTLTINPGNDPPTAANDSYGVAVDNTLVVSAPGVLANDTDPDGNALSAALVSSPTHETLSLSSNGSFTYTPDASFVGQDVFTYRASDGQANSNTATVTINVSTNNRSPVANNDAYSVNEDATLTVAAPGVLGNDTDPDGDALTATLVTSTTNGSLTLNANGSFTYVPASNFIGSDGFTYRARDPGGLTSNATVALQVTPLTLTFGPA